MSFVNEKRKERGKIASTIASAALIVNARSHRLDGKLAALALQQTSVDGSEAHVRVLGRIQILRGATRHASRHKRGAVVADC